MIKFTVKGSPIPLKRHRSTRSGRMYDPSAKDKQDFILQANNRFPKKPTNATLHMHLTFCYKRPQNHYRSKNKQKILKDNMPYYKKSTPDIDNLVKFYLDAMQGHIYKNDSQVVSIGAVKVYGEEDFVHIKISHTK